MLRIRWATGWSVWELSGDQRIQNIFKMCKDVPLTCYIPTWEWTVFSCQTVPNGCDKYVIGSMSLLVHMAAAAVDPLCELETDGRQLGTRSEILVSTCKEFNFRLCNSRMSRSGGSGLGRT
jgi:hypothetical protein